MSAPETLVHRIAHWAEATPHAPALHEKRGGRWQSVNWARYYANVRAIAKALIADGHRPGDCVAIVGANRPQWVQYQFGIQAASGIPAPIYVTNTQDQAAYIVSHSRAKLLIADGEEQVAKLLAAEAEGSFPKLERIYTFDRIDRADSDPRIESFDELIHRGRGLDDADVDARIDALDPDQTCMLIYTSGTTGVPKGVELTHRGQLVVGNGVLQWAPHMAEPGMYHCLSYLPLCHQAEQLVTNVANLMAGGQAYFCPDIAEIKDYLVDVRPTLFLGVPRVWEKFEAALRARLGEATGIKAKLADWCIQTELSCFDEQVKRGVSDRDFMPLRRRIARKLVVGKIKDALGLDRLEIALTGSAPLGVPTQRFFAGLGISINEAYGLSETSGLATLSDRLRPKLGTVGKALVGVDIRIADDGEIQIKGGNNTKGYLHMPEQTDDLYTEDGWLHTGDLGSMDAEGNVKITGRIKELLITAGGKNVAPVEIEHHVQTVPGVGQAVVVGDRKPYLCALIALDPEALPELTDLVGAGSGLSVADAAANAKVRSFIEDRIEHDCNAKLARYQTIKKFAILPNEFSVEGGELTATMKLRRSIINDKYADVIEGFYGSVA